MRKIVYTWGLAVAIAAVMITWPHPAIAAAVNPVPEVDGSLMATGLGALVGGVLILRSYFGRRG